MGISVKVKDYLEEKNISYQVMEHPLAFTASEVAGSRHIPGKQMVKSVIVKADDQYFMCVLPAIHLIDFEKLSKISGLSGLELAEEEELANLFPDYEVGAEPPFGHLHGLTVYADKMLAEDDTIVFNAGTHTDVIKMKYKDFIKLVDPKIGDIGTHI